MQRSRGTALSPPFWDVLCRTGVFIPSGGRKWVGEASYVMEAAIANRVHLRLGHPNLQPTGSTAESGQSVLECSPFGDSETASPRSGRIRHVATRGPAVHRGPICAGCFRCRSRSCLVLNELPASRLTHQRESRACHPALMLRWLKLQSQCHLGYPRPARVTVVKGGRAAQRAEGAVVLRPIASKYG